MVEHPNNLIQRRDGDAGISPGIQGEKLYIVSTLRDILLSDVDLLGNNLTQIGCGSLQGIFKCESPVPL